MSDDDITRLLAQARDGEPERLSAVFGALYPQLVRLANSRMRGNEATITPIVLVHELYLRISQGAPLPLRDREHVFAASARAMRWILVERARAFLQARTTASKKPTGRASTTTSPATRAGTTWARSR